MATVQLVRNMVCRRCIESVTEALERSGIVFNNVRLGEIDLVKPLSEKGKAVLGSLLSEKGFELIDARTNGLVEQIKRLIIQKARGELNEKESRLKLSTLLSEKFHYEYSHLSNLFSGIEGRTIENFYIEQRMEFAKELIIYDELTLSEIADKLDYSSVAHLSAQFKKVTGLTPSHFKKLGASKRRSIDEV